MVHGDRCLDWGQETHDGLECLTPIYTLSSLAMGSSVIMSPRATHTLSHPREIGVTKHKTHQAWEFP